MTKTSIPLDQIMTRAKRRSMDFKEEPKKSSMPLVDKTNYYYYGINEKEPDIDWTNDSKQKRLKKTSKLKQRLSNIPNKSIKKKMIVPLVVEETSKMRIYAEAKSIFSRATIPEQIMGRNEERIIIDKFWKTHVEQMLSGSLYISGSPGTGKTALINEIAVELELWKKQKQVKYHMIKINCMLMSESSDIYKKMVKSLSNKECDSVAEAIEILQVNLFLRKKTRMNLIILDEIDHLITKDQEVLYKLFEWAADPASNLVLIGIANALDLTERLLPRLRSKNCEPQLLNFNPYNADHIASIIRDRLRLVQEKMKNVPDMEEFQLMDASAIDLCSKKVGSISGDLRKALDICRQAIEVVEMEAKSKSHDTETVNSLPQVRINHILKVVGNVFGNPYVQKIRNLPLHQKLLLATILAVFAQKRTDLTLQKLWVAYLALCMHKKLVSPVSRTEYTDLCATLESSGVVTISKGKDERSRKITVNVQEDDIRFALNDSFVNMLLDNGLPSLYRLI